MRTIGGPARGPICQEEPAIRAAGFILIVLLAGCGPGFKDVPKEAERKQPDKKVDRAEVRGGNATRFSTDEPRRPLWQVEWSTAEIQYNEAGEIGGQMNGASGVLFKDGKAASRFRAGDAKSEFGSQNLSIGKGVTVEVDSPKAKITCEEVLWNPDLERIEAHGKVVFEAERIVFGPFEKLYASPDLKEISTPSLFQKKL